jgi:hypothetical protein
VRRLRSGVSFEEAQGVQISPSSVADGFVFETGIDAIAAANANQNRCLFCCFCANFSGFFACSLVVRALINSCASVKPHSVIEIYMLVAPILSPAAMARTIFSRSSAVGSRLI